MCAAAEGTKKRRGAPTEYQPIPPPARQPFGSESEAGKSRPGPDERQTAAKNDMYICRTNIQHPNHRI